MSVERVGISKKSENHIQKKSTPFLWTSFQGVGKSPPGWDFPPTSLLLRGVGFQPGGRKFMFNAVSCKLLQYPLVYPIPSQLHLEL